MLSVYTHKWGVWDWNKGFDRLFPVSFPKLMPVQSSLGKTLMEKPLLKSRILKRPQRPCYNGFRWLTLAVHTSHKKHTKYSNDGSNKWFMLKMFNSDGVLNYI